MAGGAEFRTESDPADGGSLPAARRFAEAFSRFTPDVRFWWDAGYFHVASDGIPTTHPQMAGISAWQRQIPLPMYYYGTNEWRLPLKPVVATKPKAITTNTFLQGAIALAANGVPIFNPANNRGEVSALIGELDRWGGHCGRADDYHYHAAPLHLTNTLGISLPIAFALDGYPIYGLVEPDGTNPGELDAFHGHSTDALGYHYHASTQLPYVNGGFRGEVEELVSTNGQGQVVSQAGWQPRATGVRPSGTALNGAFIHGITNLGPDRHQMFFSIPSNAPPTNSWLWALDRDQGTVTVTYSPYAVGGGLVTSNYTRWRARPAMVSTAEPLVTAQPADLRVSAGSDASIKAVVSGALPLSFQWLKDGIPMVDGDGIVGSTTSELWLASVRTGDEGGYSVLVTNFVGASVSRIARLALGASTGSVSQGMGTVTATNLYPAGQRLSRVGQVTATDGTQWTVPSVTHFSDGRRLPNLYNPSVGVTPTNILAVDLKQLPLVEVDPDGEEIIGYLYGDNYFELYVNGVLVGVDPVPYTPFNSCVVRFKARRPVTYAVRLVDWEENLGVGTELNSGNPHHAGDGGFIASFSDGTVTGPHWKAQSFYIAPLDDPGIVVERADGTHDSTAASKQSNFGADAYAVHYPEPGNWFSPAYTGETWPAAVTYTPEQVGIKDQWAYLNFVDQLRAGGAQFIWSANLVLDNVVLARFTSAGASSNSSPVFPSMATRRFVLAAGESFSLTHRATDPDGVSQTLTYGLASAPSGVTIDSATGDFHWTPTAQQAGTSNAIQVVVTDNGIPVRKATNEFTILVRSLQPNVVILVTDDHGWGDLGAHGGQAKTPNLDRLGVDGIRLERFYATPVCSVSRSALLTGRSPNRTMVNNSRGLDLHEHLMPESFRAAGYQTYMCGKWHLGGLYNTASNVVVDGVAEPVVRENVEYQPQNRGWDVHYGEYTGAIQYQSHVSQETGELDWWLNGQPNADEGWSTDLLADRAIELLRQRDPSKPVLLYLAFNAVHGPVSAPAGYLEQFPGVTGNRQKTLAALRQLDDAVGRVLDVIDADGMRTNTIVAFFGDNGGQAQSGGSNLPLRGDKGDLFDGGIHTPAAIRWPGVLPSGVTNCQQFIWVGDLFPTLCAATGVTPRNQKPFDGRNLWTRLLAARNGAFDPGTHDSGPFSAGSTAGSAVFDVFEIGTSTTMFKLIREKQPGQGAGFVTRLFDIIADPFETNDLANVGALAGVVTSLTGYYTSLSAERYPPYFGAHPRTGVTAAGGNATLWALVTAYAKPVRVQWRKNGQAINGATNLVAVDGDVYLAQLRIAGASEADAGHYDVVATDNASGWGTATATSRVAVVTIGPGTTNATVGLPKLADTGQAGDFTPVFGEDADYVINPPSYTDHGDGTVTDNITGLMWAKQDSAELSWAAARVFAQTNRLAGHGDWRLPSAHELHGILAFGQNPPQFDRGIFSLTGTGNTHFWWTGESRTDNTNLIWSVGNNGVMSARPVTDTASSGGANSYHVRLVRGEPLPGRVPMHTWLVGLDGTVTDQNTGLMWQRVASAETLDWTNALAYAEGLALGGYSDWRLPNVRELRSINDERKANPSLDANAFPSATGVRYWSSTSQNQQPTRAWFVDAQFGNTGQALKTDRHLVRTVRGPVLSGPINSPPAFTAQDDRTLNPGYMLVVTNLASDPDRPAQRLRYRLVDPPGNAVIDSDSGVLVFSPSIRQLWSTNEFVVVATDDGVPPMSATNRFLVWVLANTAPTLGELPPRTMEAGHTLLLSPTASDAESPPQHLKFSLAQAPEGAVIDPGSGKVQWQSTVADAGSTKRFVVVVSDDGIPALIGARAFDVGVSAPNTPASRHTVILGRPTESSVGVSVLADSDLHYYVEYGEGPGAYSGSTSVGRVAGGVPTLVNLGGLEPNRRYYYRLRYSPSIAGPFAADPEGTFATQRARGSTFTFLVEADPHHRDNEPEVWRRTLNNMMLDQADFLIDLGDTFMEEKIGITNSYFLTEPGIQELHREVRTDFFSVVGPSLPLYLVNGNHEAELGWLLRLLQVTNNPAVWGAKARKSYFPVPEPGGFYSGATGVDPSLQGPRDGYYAFEWGDALFVALDPFWYTTAKPQQDGWAWTLGSGQYEWLKRTLESSSATYKFVFAHHLLGGGGGVQARGGLAYHNLFEWGGHGTNGVYEFGSKRPGWGKPIKDLLLENNVQVFFHGHDHLYVKEDFFVAGNTNGPANLIYQEVPQPSRVPLGTNSAAGYGYTNAGSVVLGGSGHLRVTVSPTGAQVEYVRSYLPANEGPGRTNRMVSHSYRIPPSASPGRWSLAALPDTGQTGDFTPVPGEDSDYLIHSQSFQRNPDGTTVDNVTGLIWQTTDGGEMTWARALDYAATSRVGGFADWRLPLGYELISLFNYSLNNPALDIRYFESAGPAPAQYWWTSELRADDTNRVWAANAGGGIGPHLKSETLSAGGGNRYHVRLVRGASSASVSPATRFVDHGDGTVSDSYTGLMWQRDEVSAPMAWTDALHQTEGLVLGGFKDWRLPNIKELQSLNDPGRVNPSVDLSRFPGAKSARYWSSTTQINQTARAWFMDFQFGIASQEVKSTPYWIRAVRGGLSNTPPALAEIPAQMARAGTTLTMTNTAVDAETAPGFLRYKLTRGPTTATIGAADGALRWRPGVAQAGTTQLFTVTVADSGTPVLEARRDFTVTVPPMEQVPTAAPMGRNGQPFGLRISGDAGLDYAVQFSTNLYSWSDVFVTNSPPVPFLWYDSDSSPSGLRFYRLRIGP